MWLRGVYFLSRISLISPQRNACHQTYCRAAALHAPQSKARAAAHSEVSHSRHRTGGGGRPRRREGLRAYLKPSCHTCKVRYLVRRPTCTLLAVFGCLAALLHQRVARSSHLLLQVLRAALGRVIHPHEAFMRLRRACGRQTRERSTAAQSSQGARASGCGAHLQDLRLRRFRLDVENSARLALCHAAKFSCRLRGGRPCCCTSICTQDGTTHGRERAKRCESSVGAKVSVDAEGTCFLFLFLRLRASL